MKKNNVENTAWIMFQNDLLVCLSDKTNHKYTRFDAFMWLIDNMQPSNKVSYVNGVSIEDASISISYTRLADLWHWTRQTVENFMSELEKKQVLTKTKTGRIYNFCLSQNTIQKIKKNR